VETTRTSMMLRRAVFSLRAGACPRAGLWPDPGARGVRRLLRTRADNFAGARENQKEDIRKTAIAAHQIRCLK
jgi:hypothetical protein